MSRGWILPTSLAGTVLLLISKHAQAFATIGRPSLVPTSQRLSGHGRGVAPVPKNPRSRALFMSDEEVIYDEFGEIVFDEDGNINEKLLDDYQVNPDGIEQGDAVIVAEKGLRFFHVRKFKAEGFDPEGMIGEIQQLKVISTKHRGEFFTANRPVFVQFKHPYKFKAHFEFGEVRKATQEELDKQQEEIAVAEAEQAAAAEVAAAAKAAAAE